MSSALISDGFSRQFVLKYQPSIPKFDRYCERIGCDYRQQNSLTRAQLGAGYTVLLMQDIDSKLPKRISDADRARILAGVFKRTMFKSDRFHAAVGLYSNARSADGKMLCPHTFSMYAEVLRSRTSLGRISRKVSDHLAGKK